LLYNFGHENLYSNRTSSVKLFGTDIDSGPRRPHHRSRYQVRGRPCCHWVGLAHRPTHSAPSLGEALVLALGEALGHELLGLALGEKRLESQKRLRVKSVCVISRLKKSHVKISRKNLT
jgi:hypothetical protein